MIDDLFGQCAVLFDCIGEGCLAQQEMKLMGIGAILKCTDLVLVIQIKWPKVMISSKFRDRVRVEVERG